MMAAQQRHFVYWKEKAMYKIITPLQMRRLESLAISDGVKSMGLMERAAECVVDELIKLLDGAGGKQVAFFCGRGNNGGDGLAAARLFQKAGGSSFVILQEEPLTNDALLNYSRIKELNIPISGTLPDSLKFDGAVDALLGIGLKGSLSTELKRAIAAMNAMNTKVLSVDIPSGMDALTGACSDGCVKAHKTLTFQYPKPGHFLSKDLDSIGELVVADIGLEHYAQKFQLIESLQIDDLSASLPKRSCTAHKGSHGRVLLYCGSLGMAGAAAMAALACMRAGAGLVYVVCNESIMPILQILAPNAQCLSIEEALTGRVNHDVFLAGCGLGQEKQTWQNILKIYSRDVPAVFDADVLNLLAANPMKLSEKTIITPHVGEAARLLGVSPSEVSNNMLSSSAALAHQYGAVVLLKSHCSVIQDEEKIGLNTISAPILAKGGSGDALAGIIAGLLAQGLKPFEAARTASIWLSKAALLAQQEGGLYSPLTGDILALMGKVSL